MTLPNFLVIGAEKAGTTSLDYYLHQHPQIYMSPMKEPRFYAPEFYTEYFRGPRVGKRTEPMLKPDYEALFDAVADEAVVGEVSPQYLYLPDCCDRISAALPDAKIIAVLRNPAERAFSAYAYQLTCGYDTENTFEEALALESDRVTQKWRPVWHYQSLGFYFSQLQSYFERFPQENIGVFFYDDLCEDAIAFSQSVYKFLGVDGDFEPDVSAKNMSGQPKNRAMHNLLNRDNPVKAVVKSLMPKGARKSMGRFLKQSNTKPKPKLSAETKQRLIEVYRSDIVQLQDLVGRDLSPWLEV